MVEHLILLKMRVHHTYMYIIVFITRILCCQGAIYVCIVTTTIIAHNIYQPCHYTALCCMHIYSTACHILNNFMNSSYICRRRGYTCISDTTLPSTTLFLVLYRVSSVGCVFVGSLQRITHIHIYSNNVKARSVVLARSHVIMFVAM